MRVQILVRLKGGVLDVQGKAVERSLHELGFQQVEHVRVGKLIELDLPAGDSEKARELAEEMCRALLVNQVIEQYEIKIGERI